MSQKIIVGITGTHGSGKGTIVDYLKTQGYTHFSATALMRTELERRGQPVNRLGYSLLANEWRAQFGSEYIADTLYKQAQASSDNALIEAIYTIGEIDKLRSAAQAGGEKFVLLAIDADQKVRYERIQEHRKGEKDNVTFREFVAHEAGEMKSSDPSRQNLAACRERADIVLFNNGSKEDLFRELDEKLGMVQL